MSITPDLDQKVGKYLTLRDLVECGETWARHSAAGKAIDNTPCQAETLSALSLLCELVLDPVREAFGPPVITYGHAGLKLSRAVQREVGRVVPRTDQHSSHELDNKGGALCQRGGAAVDFAIRGIGALDLALWVAEQTHFDRLTIYGPERPIHVSVSVNPVGQVVRMRSLDSGRMIPQVLSLEKLRMHAAELD